jgi:hypothetical protein
VGCNRVRGGFGIYQEESIGRTSGWVERPGGAVSLGVDDSGSGNAWVTQDGGQIYRWTGSAWVSVPGCGHNIDVGADGSVWVVGCNPVLGGFGIYRWNGSGWVQQPGGAVSIGVNPNGTAWVTNNIGQIYSSS